MEHFHFISDKGKIALPSKKEISDHFEKTGEHIIFVLDSSVCLDIVNLVSWKEKSRADKLKIFNLIQYAQVNNIEHLSIFALLESSYDRKTLEIQFDKFNDFNEKIYFAFSFPTKRFRRLQFNFLTDFHATRPKEIQKEIVKSLIDTRVNAYYAGLLKICEISQKGLGQNIAEKNIQDFIDWMEYDLGFFLGSEYSLALQIFGGNSKFRSMLKIGSTKDNILKAALGTAWDLFHAKMSCNNEMISELVSRSVRPIFVTKDSALYDLIAPTVSHYIKHKFTKLSLIIGDKYPPNYSNSFMEKLNEKMLKLSSERFYRGEDIDIDKVKVIIRNLENKIK